jgi:hypothetical protein
MKKHPDITPEMVIQEAFGNAKPEDITKVSGGPETPEERVEAFESMKQALEDHMNKILIQCIACDDQAPLMLSGMCVCGGFVCPACIAVEEDGVCEHDAPEIPGEES